LLAGAPKADTPQARKAFSARLSNLAKTEPAIANELNLYRSMIEKTANDNAGRMSAVAEDGQQEMPEQ